MEAKNRDEVYQWIICGGAYDIGKRPTFLRFYANQNTPSSDWERDWAQMKSQLSESLNSAAKTQTDDTTQLQPLLPFLLELEEPSVEAWTIEKWKSVPGRFLDFHWKVCFHFPWTEMSRIVILCLTQYVRGAGNYFFRNILTLSLIGY